MEPALVHRLDQYETWQRETIRRHGWALQAVLGDASTPPFVYTVGLAGFGHPELIVFALGRARAAELLNRLGEIVRAGGRLGPGDTRESASLLAFPEAASWLLAAQRLYRITGGPAVPALLVVPEEVAGEDGGEEDGPGEVCTICD